MFAFLNKILGDIPIKDVYMITDAQVVLSWILTEFVHTENIFLQNRLQDIAQMTENIKLNFGIKVNFRYVSTADNPADYITRVLKFREKLSNWYEGPEWIKQDRSSVNYVTKREATAIADVRMEKFSSLNKLISMTSLVFKFINRLRKREMDLKLQANSYLIKTMQRQSFSVELDFLLDPEGKSMPKLVRYLNLFLDPKDIIGSRGRKGRSKCHPYEVQNPILLGKGHHMTKLIIQEYHQKSQQLGLGTTLN